jgi:endonuclease G, mitochondrial
VSHREDVQNRRMETAVRAAGRFAESTARREETARLLALGGPRMAESPDRVAKYRAREALKLAAVARAGATETFLFERKIGPTLDLDDHPPSDAARLAGVPIGRIVELDDRDNVRDGFATGFLIAPALMMTNHHVFATANETSGCAIQFGYEDVNGSVAVGTIFRLDAGIFFYTDSDLDFTVIGVTSTATDCTALSTFKSLPLIPTTGKIMVGMPISIIQYPDGGTKKYGVRDNKLLLAPADDDLFLQYSTDTLPGSSGSPAFNEDWEVVALHHSGVPEIVDGRIMTTKHEPWDRSMPDSAIHWVANEGARVSCLCEALSKAKVKPEHQAALSQLVRSYSEDFEDLPAVQSRKEVSQMDSKTSEGTPGISIIVNGTANFYMASDTTAAHEMPAAFQTPRAMVSPAPVEEKKIRFDPDYDNRPGYQEDFLGIPVPPPKFANEDEALKEGDKVLVLNYHHYSLAMHRKRRLLMWSAVNVDYTKSKRRKKREDFGTDTWREDPRIAAKFQIEDQELYNPALRFDRGHIVRRDDTAWGETALEEIFANSDSFHWTNCSPQHEQFNRAMFDYHGLWGELENHIASQAKNVGKKISIFAGPILDDKNDIKHDFGGGEMLVPRRFWKVVLAAEDADSDSKLCTYGFILDQSEAIDEFGLEKFSAGKFTTYQYTLQKISETARVIFHDKVLAADAMAGAPEESWRIRLESLNDVRMGFAKG